MSSNFSTLRALIISVIVLAGIVVGVVTGAVSLALGVGVPSAFKAAGGAFLGCASLGIASLMVFLT